MKKKSIRTKGKLSFSRYFQEFKNGDVVSFVKELSVPSNIPDRYQGRTGVVDGKRGRSYIVLIKDNNKPKKFIIQPIHLKKIENK
ncbi:MAG: 50S ribosomal protein L21e [Nanoarchaeota archaeon]